MSLLKEYKRLQNEARKESESRRRKKDAQLVTMGEDWFQLADSSGNRRQLLRTAEGTSVPTQNPTSGTMALR